LLLAWLPLQDHTRHERGILAEQNMQKSRT